MNLLNCLISISESNIEYLTSAIRCHTSCLSFYDKQLQNLESILYVLKDIQNDSVSSNEQEDSNVNG